MIKKLSASSDFTKNVLTLMTGTSIAQAIPIATSPILTRIYTPEDFGIFALFISIVTILGTVANARYEMAIVLPSKDEDALNIASLGLIIATIVSLVVLIFVVLFNEKITMLIGNDDLAKWLYLAPVSVWIIGVFNVLKYLNVRYENYKNIAGANVFRALVSATIQLFFGFLKPGVLGLISAQIISSFIACLCMIKKILSYQYIRQNITIISMKKQALIYKDFPMFSLWSALANTLSFNVTNILISTFYSVGTLGFYSLVNRVLGMPISLLGNSIGQVFYQQACIEKRETGRVIKSFKSTFKKLLVISIIPFGILYLTIEDLFILVFGEHWKIAGEYAKIFIPLFFIRFLVSPLSAVNQINKKNKIAMLWQFGLLLITAGIILYCNYFGIKFSEMAIYMTYILSIYYLYLLFIIYFYAANNSDE